MVERERERERAGAAVVMECNTEGLSLQVNTIGDSSEQLEIRARGVLESHGCTVFPNRVGTRSLGGGCHGCKEEEEEGARGEMAGCFQSRVVVNSTRL